MNPTRRTLLAMLLLTAAATAGAQGENMNTIADGHHLSAYLVAALLIGLFVMVFSNRLYYYQEKEVNAKAKRLNTQLALVLDSSNTQIWTYEVATHLFTLYSEQAQKTTQYMPIDFSQYFNHDDFITMRNLISSIEAREREEATLTVRGHDTGIYEVSVSVLHRDQRQRPTIIIGTQRDVTDDKTRQLKARRLTLRFHTVFNSSLIDMVFYDKDGYLSDINDKACETFGITDRESLIRRHVHISEIPAYSDLDISALDSIKASSMTDVSKVKREGEHVPEITVSGKMYYEASVSAVRDENGQLRGIITAGRDITEMVLSQHRQQAYSRLLQQATRNVQAYIDNINYTLRVSGVRLLNYYPDTHEMEVASDLSKPQFRLSQVRCLSLVDEASRRRAQGFFIRMDRRRHSSFMETFHTRFRDAQGRDIFLTFSMVPVTEGDGRVTHYFGMIRDDTEMHYTEERLRQETEKAQETEELKNTFLLNMSYEIRTPLNAVLGFAELFNGPHDEEDEPVFAQEIRRNTGELLELIDDILFISRLDARMVEMKKDMEDFACLFDGYCYMGWSSPAPGVTLSVVNPYNHLIVNIDSQNLGLVIQKLCAQAASHTSQGYIRAKYEYRHGELNIAIEDTGTGVPPEDLSHIFDRFARDRNDNRYGTGLNLPIVKEIVEQMGGSIEIQSEVGKGSTVYIIIPCEMSSMEKKTDLKLA